jgi:hypothetical protein
MDDGDNATNLIPAKRKKEHLRTSQTLLAKNATGLLHTILLRGTANRLEPDIDEQAQGRH